MDESQKVLLKVAKDLGDKYIYYSPALDHLRFEREDNIQTMGISAKLVLSYNFNFVKSLSHDEVRGVIMHEIMHFLSEHHKRELNSPFYKTVDHMIHNCAMDMEINCRLKKMDNLKLPKDGCFPDNFIMPDGSKKKFPDGLTYENYLKLIIKELQNFVQQNPQYVSKDGKGMKIGMFDKQLSGKGGSGKPDGSLSKEDDVKQGTEPGGGTGYTPDTDNLIDDLKDKGEEKVQKSRGTGSNGSELIRNVEEKKYPWEKIVRNIVMKENGTIAQGYEFKTYKYYNKRNVGEIINPVWKTREYEMNLIVIMDVSGSMYNIIEDMYKKLKFITHSVNGNINTTIIETDTEVLNVIKNFDLKARTIRSTNGGGTDLRCAWDYIANNKMRPDLIICMSDGYTPWKDKKDANALIDKTVCILSENPDAYSCPYKWFPSEF